MSYLVCNGDETNGASQFSVDTLNIGVDYTKATLTVNKSSSGGRPKETIDSIKFNAPRNYQTQNRKILLCALLENDTAKCFGRNDDGRLGDG